MSISAKNLTIHRLGRPVLRDVSLHIGDGECICVIGPNGAGKSSLMAALLGLLPVSDGAVLLDETPIHRLSRRAIARRVAYVPQIHEGYMGFRVREVVESGRYAYLDPLDSLSEEDQQAIRIAVEACRIEPLLDRPLDTLSGGERQKVWIAAALAQQTSILFLDEPTNALDPAHQAELIRIMRDFSTAGKTLLVICHDLNLPPMLGGRVLALREGRAVFTGSVEALLDTDRLREIFHTDFVTYTSADGQRSVQLKL